MKPVDYFSNRITMYRLILYYMIGLLLVAAIFGQFKIIAYQPLPILFSTIFILVVCWVTNKFFSYMFDAPTNVESVYITALIFALLITPIANLGDSVFYTMAGWASVWAMASKYIFAIRKKHIFNPAAFGVAIMALFTASTSGLSATWWVGTGVLLPFVIIGGLLITHKIRRFDLFLSFVATALVLILGYDLVRGFNLVSSFQKVFMDTPILFLAFVMLTEPLTTPPTRPLRFAYGILTGIAYAPFVTVAGISSTPELALLAGNIFSYIVSPKYKLMLTLVDRKKVANDTYDFIFSTNRKVKFKAGQYFEWTLPHDDFDSRGNRRYFTIASSPTEKNLRIGVKFYPKPSTFKQAMLAMRPGDVVTAGQLSGDFTLPKDASKKIVCIAGGIGVTPFRSMIKYMVDTGEKRPLTLFYSNKEITDVAYTDIFDAAYEKFGMHTIYTLTDVTKAPPGWLGETGFIDEKMLKRELPDYLDCTYYISGPQSLVDAFKVTLARIGVHKTSIKTDYFPGFA